MPLPLSDPHAACFSAHSSTAGVTKFLSPSVSGFLLQKELDYLGGAVDDPKRPFAAIVGGSKVRIVVSCSSRSWRCGCSGSGEQGIYPGMRILESTRELCSPIFKSCT